MAVKVQFEIGHAYKLKSKKTPEGFTHDWELFVRGIEKRDISQFVEKVVFNLHDSFPKPKRVIKEAPYVLKESGYAGFNLPIDIYFKNRDEPKRVTYNYDLSLQNTGPPATITQVKKFVFNNPSEDFRRKLLRGGGIPLVNTADEKSRDSTDSQLLNKQKASADSSKKHKIRPDDGKMPTFDTLFGPPITKTTTKVSPDPKSKSSPNISASSKSKPPLEKGSTPSSNSVAPKEKGDKRDKREKHKHSSPHKDKSDSTSKDGRKSSLGDEKHERRDEKKKDKSHSKDRERSKDKNLKRPASPKRFSSPKASSPARSASAASRNDESEGKTSTRSNHSDAQNVSSSNMVEKASTNNSSGSGSKKSKKEKKSHEKDKEREKKDKERDRKEKDDRSNTTNNISSIGNVNHSSNSNINAKVNVETKVDFNKKENNTVPQTLPKEVKDKKPVEPKSIETVSANVEKKDKEKHDKDGEKKHKHKKKDKTKEREKDKDYASKDKKKDKPAKQKDDFKKVPAQTQPVVEATSQKPNPLNTLMNEISEGESSDSDNESHTTPSLTEKPENVVETSNSSMPDVVVTRPSPSTLEDTKTDKKERKSREKIKGEDRKRKRKSKEDNDSQTRKSDSPAIPPVIAEPPAKQMKKETLAAKRDKSMSPHVMTQSAAPPLNTILAPPVAKANTADDSAFRPPSAAPTAATAAGPSSTNNFQAVNHDRALTVDYMSELRELQKKIMTLQDNKELQQVVEMIAATGRFEITSKTFDFDLCALDRHTVQRLQDFFATSCS